MQPNYLTIYKDNFRSFLNYFSFTSYSSSVFRHHSFTVIKSMSRSRHMDIRFLPSLSPSSSFRDLLIDIPDWSSQLPTTPRPSTAPQNRTSPPRADSTIAHILGLDTERMFTFSTTRPCPSNQLHESDDELALRLLELSVGNTNSSRRWNSRLTKSQIYKAPESRKPPRTLQELQYLITYGGLTVNYHHNLITWSPLGNILIAIQQEAWLWDGRRDIERVAYYREMKADISCIQCSKQNSIAVATVDKKLIVLQYLSKGSLSLKLSSTVLCVAWLPDGKRLFAGDQSGKVHYIEIQDTLKIISTMGGFKKRIYGTHQFLLPIFTNEQE